MTDIWVYNLELGPGSLWAQRYGAANCPHGGVKLGSQKGVILAAQNEPKFGGDPNSISPRRLGDGICHSIRDPPGVQQRLPCPGLLKIIMPLGVVTIPIGSRDAKMAKFSTLTLG